MILRIIITATTIILCVGRTINTNEEKQQSEIKQIVDSQDKLFTEWKVLQEKIEKLKNGYAELQKNYINCNKLMTLKMNKLQEYKNNYTHLQSKYNQLQIQQKQINNQNNRSNQFLKIHTISDLLPKFCTQQIQFTIFLMAFIFALIVTILILLYLINQNKKLRQKYEAQKIKANNFKQKYNEQLRMAARYL